MTTTDSEQLEHVLGETVYSADDVSELADSMELAVHNMWVEARKQDLETGEYGRVDVDIEITVRDRSDLNDALE